MECIDWRCGKNKCKINNNIKNSFHYITCKECTVKKKLSLCQTCVFGLRLNNQRYLCKKDNTYGLMD